MAWRDELRPASFRGAAFKVATTEHSGGRRGELTEFPQRDQPFWEDLGRKARAWSVEAIVIGPDYLAARNALIRALETEGPGELVHPSFGTVSVALAAPFRVSETDKEGGMAAFSLEFVEAGAALTPAVLDDTPGQASAAADASIATSSASFAGRFDVLGHPAFVSTQAQRVVGLVTLAARTAARGLPGAGEALYAFGLLARGLDVEADQLVRAPVALAARLALLMGAMRPLAGGPAEAFAVLAPLTAVGSVSAAAPGATPARVQQSTNEAALVNLTRRLAGAEAARAAAEMTFGSYQEAAAARDTLAGALEALALDAGDTGEDEAYAGLADLRAAVVRDITARGGSLARLVEVTLNAPAPALVLAQRLYGDPERETAILARNLVGHPGFLPAGAALQVEAP